MKRSYVALNLGEQNKANKLEVRVTTCILDT